MRQEIRGVECEGIVKTRSSKLFHFQGTEACSLMHGGMSLLISQLQREGTLLTRFEFNNSLLLQESSFHCNVSASIPIKLYDS